MTYKPLTITNRSFSANVYLAPDLYSEMESKKNREGQTRIELFKAGRVARGLKHLIQTLQNKNSKRKIVFSKGTTKSDSANWFINFDEYTASVSGRFYSLYRETGLDGALFYLSTKIPSEFDYDKSRLSDKQVKEIDKKLPEVLKVLEKKAKNKKLLFQNTNESLKALKEEKESLKAQIQSVKEIRDSSSIAVMTAAIHEFDQRLDEVKEYKETSGKDHWQGWIYKNNWMFGANYGKPIEKEKIGFDNIPDFLFPTIDGFVDILEIKLPKHELIKEDEDHPGSYMWTPKASEAIGQVVNYLHQIELNQLQIQERIKEKYDGTELLMIKPRAYILIGNSKGWKDKDKKALRKLNFSLHGIEVLTYYDLKQRAERIIKLYE